MPRKLPPARPKKEDWRRSGPDWDSGYNKADDFKAMEEYRALLRENPRATTPGSTSAADSGFAFTEFTGAAEHIADTRRFQGGGATSPVNKKASLDLLKKAREKSVHEMLNTARVHSRRGSRRGGSSSGKRPYSTASWLRPGKVGDFAALPQPVLRSSKSVSRRVSFDFDDGGSDDEGSEMLPSEEKPVIGSLPWDEDKFLATQAETVQGLTVREMLGRAGRVKKEKPVEKVREMDVRMTNDFLDALRARRVKETIDAAWRHEEARIAKEPSSSDEEEEVPRKKKQQVLGLKKREARARDEALLQLVRIEAAHGHLLREEVKKKLGSIEAILDRKRNTASERVCAAVLKGDPALLRANCSLLSYIPPLEAKGMRALYDALQSSAGNGSHKRRNAAWLTGPLNNLRASKEYPQDPLVITATKLLNEDSTDERQDVLCILSKQGAAMEVRDSGGLSVMHHAALTGDAASVRLIYDLRSSLLNDVASDDLGFTPLMLAIQRCRSRQRVLSVSFALIQLGCRLDVADRHGRTALHLAASRPNLRPLLAVLLAADAPTEATDNAGKSPADAALATGQRGAAELIRRYRAQHAHATELSMRELVNFNQTGDFDHDPEEQEEDHIPASLQGVVLPDLNKAEVEEEDEDEDEFFNRVRHRAEQRRIKARQTARKNKRENTILAAGPGKNRRKPKRHPPPSSHSDNHSASPTTTTVLPRLLGPESHSTG